MSSDKVLLQVSADAALEISNIGHGAFAPLKGFMVEGDYRKVVETMRLSDGSPWTIPVTLDVPEGQITEVLTAGEVILVDDTQTELAKLTVQDIFKVDFPSDLKHIYGTDDPSHPGVAKESSRSPYRVGGRIEVLNLRSAMFDEYGLTPKQCQERFKANGWKTIVGFQTRNPPHLAHEYLQRVSLEIFDGLLLHPLIGWKKADDFSPEAVVRAYEVMVKKVYPENRALLATLETPMRYAGPREAVFHAIVRRNYGCTHFIVGRDHAGVGGFYDRYAAHRLCEQFDDLGIEILKMHGPFFCERSQMIVTEKTCVYGDEFKLEVSGTKMRAMLSSGERPPVDYMRAEIADELIELGRQGKLFCGSML